MKTARRLGWLCLLAATAAFAADNPKQFRFPVSTGASVTINNQYGPVTLRAGSGKDVVVTATPHSAKVEVDESHTASRVDLTSHILQSASPDEARVDYEVQVPLGTTVTVHAPTGPIQVEGVGGDLSLESDAGEIHVAGSSDLRLRARTVDGAITVAKVTGAHVEANSVGGNITFDTVAGPKVSASTNSGAIQFTGDCSGGGDYSLITHSGDITLALPAAASVDITARSVSGSVQNDFPFQPAQHTAMALVQGRSLAGRANSGASSVVLRSFSGTIRVKKQ